MNNYDRVEGNDDVQAQDQTGGGGHVQVVPERQVLPAGRRIFPVDNQEVIGLAP